MGGKAEEVVTEKSFIRSKRGEFKALSCWKVRESRTSRLFKEV